MAIVIIETPEKYRINCNTCEVRLEFEKTDIEYITEKYQPNYSYITCPHCKKKITIDDLESLKHKEKNY